MYIFLIIWFILVGIFFLFNFYGIIRVFSLKLKGDVTPIAIMIYVISLSIVIGVAMTFISTMDWSKSLQEIFRIGG